jgi:hypothetical protein
VRSNSLVGLVSGQLATRLKNSMTTMFQSNQSNSTSQTFINTAQQWLRKRRDGAHCDAAHSSARPSRCRIRITGRTSTLQTRHRCRKRTSTQASVARSGHSQPNALIEGQRTGQSLARQCSSSGLRLRNAAAVLHRSADTQARTLPTPQRSGKWGAASSQCTAEACRFQTAQESRGHAANPHPLSAAAVAQRVGNAR